MVWPRVQFRLSTLAALAFTASGLLWMFLNLFPWESSLSESYVQDGESVVTYYESFSVGLPFRCLTFYTVGWRGRGDGAVVKAYERHILSPSQRVMMDWSRCPQINSVVVLWKYAVIDFLVMVGVTCAVGVIAEKWKHLAPHIARTLFVLFTSLSMCVLAAVIEARRFTAQNTVFLLFWSALAVSSLALCRAYPLSVPSGTSRVGERSEREADAGQQEP